MRRCWASLTTWWTCWTSGARAGSRARAPARRGHTTMPLFYLPSKNQPLNRGAIHYTALPKTVQDKIHNYFFIFLGIRWLHYPVCRFPDCEGASLVSLLRHYSTIWCHGALFRHGAWCTPPPCDGMVHGALAHHGALLYKRALHHHMANTLVHGGPNRINLVMFSNTHTLPQYKLRLVWENMTIWRGIQ